MSWLSTLFGKKKNGIPEKTLADAFFKTNEVDEDFKKVMVNPDLAFREPAYKKIKEIESKIQVNPEDYKNMVFDEKIDLNDYNLKDLTEQTKQEIVRLIKIDTELRLGRRMDTEFHDDGSFTTPSGITFTPINKEDEN